MKTLTLNSVYAQSGMMPLDNEIKFDRIVRDSINAGILAKTDNARQIDKAGNLTGIDHKALTDECATYIACALPAFAKGVIKQYNDAVIAAKGATTDTEKQAAKVLLARAVRLHTWKRLCRHDIRMHQAVPRSSGHTPSPAAAC